jgi:hypothetical protein
MWHQSSQLCAPRRGNDEGADPVYLAPLPLALLTVHAIPNLLQDHLPKMFGIIEAFVAFIRLKWSTESELRSEGDDISVRSKATADHSLHALDDP